MKHVRSISAPCKWSIMEVSIGRPSAQEFTAVVIGADQGDRREIWREVARVDGRAAAVVDDEDALEAGWSERGYRQQAALEGRRGVVGEHHGHGRHRLVGDHPHRCTSLTADGPARTIRSPPGRRRRPGRCRRTTSGVGSTHSGAPPGHSGDRRYPTPGCGRACGGSRTSAGRRVRRPGGRKPTPPA